MDTSYGIKRKEKRRFFSLGVKIPILSKKSEMGGSPNCPIEFLSKSILMEGCKKSQEKFTVSLHKRHSQKTSWVMSQGNTELQTSQSNDWTRIEWKYSPSRSVIGKSNISLVFFRRLTQGRDENPLNHRVAVSEDSYTASLPLVS